MKPWCTAPTGMTLAITMKRFDGAYSGFRYNLTDDVWESAASHAYSDARVPLTEGTSEYLGHYEAASDIDQTAIGTPGSNVRFYVHDENASNQTIATIDVTIVAGEIPTGSNILAALLFDGHSLGRAIQGLYDKICGTSERTGFSMQYLSPGDGQNGFSETLSSSEAGVRSSTSTRSS